MLLSLSLLLLLLLVQGAGFEVIRESIDRNAHRQLADRLSLAERVWQRLLAQRASTLSQGAAVLAADYGIREALGTHDLGTLQSALAKHSQRIGATRADLALAQGLAQRITAAFKQPLVIDEHSVDLSAGLGLAGWPLQAQDADGLLNRAEIAMYKAKRRTAGAQVDDPAADTGSAQTLSLLSDLRRALDKHELRIYLQPKIAINTGAVCGAEALVRWQHPQRGLVLPMACLRRLPVHELKIDKSFVMAMAHAPGAAMIVGSTIDLAHTLGLTVVAEGIENEAVLSQLQALHRGEGQGFHMSKPWPVDAFQDWLARWQAR